MYRIARDIAVFFEVVKQLQRSLKPSICMATTSRFSRRLRRFSGPNLKVRRKVRQLEIIRDKRTFCARQLPHSVLFTPTFAPRLHSAATTGHGHSSSPFKRRRTKSSVYNRRSINVRRKKERKVDCRKKDHLVRIFSSDTQGVYTRVFVAENLQLSDSCYPIHVELHELFQSKIVSMKFD